MHRLQTVVGCCDRGFVGTYLVDRYRLLAVSRLEELDKVFEKVVAVLVDNFLRVLAYDQHLTNVALRLRVHLEAIGISKVLVSIQLLGRLCIVRYQVRKAGVVGL